MNYEVPQYAPVGPLSGLEMLALHGLLGKYQLLIAPVILKHDWMYADFFTKRHADQFVIVDNGVIEEGVSLDLSMLAHAAAIVDADVVVMPDTIDDARMTTKQVRNAMRHWMSNDDVTGRFKAMGVVQGRTFDECLSCAADLVEAGVEWLAVPRGLTKNLGTRVPLVLQIATEHGLPIHILGFSDNLYDDILAAACHDLVQGIDAATPMWATKWLPIHPPEDEPRSLNLGRRPEEFWRQGPSDQAAHNVEIVRRWLSAAWAVRIEKEGRVAPMDLLTLGSWSSAKHPEERS